MTHNNNVFDYKSRFSYPFIPEVHHSQYLSTTDERRNLYNTFVIMCLFLNVEQFTNMNNAIFKRIKNLGKKLLSVNSNVILRSIGFPENHKHKNAEKQQLR